MDSRLRGNDRNGRMVNFERYSLFSCMGDRPVAPTDPDTIFQVKLNAIFNETLPPRTETGHRIRFLEAQNEVFAYCLFCFFCIYKHLKQNEKVKPRLIGGRKATVLLRTPNRSYTPLLELA
jgi:hypothetical protein